MRGIIGVLVSLAEGLLGCLLSHWQCAPLLGSGVPQRGLRPTGGWITGLPQKKVWPLVSHLLLYLKPSLPKPFRTHLTSLLHCISAFERADVD